MITVHPAPSTYREGMGIFVPAVWAVPENPIERAWRADGLGRIVTGIYSYPQNQLVLDILAKAKLAEKEKGGDTSLSGLGMTVDDVLKSVTSGGWQTWALAGAAILALILFTGGGSVERHSELAAARAEYKAKVAHIKAARPRRYQRFV